MGSYCVYVSWAWDWLKTEVAYQEWAWAWLASEMGLADVVLLEAPSEHESQNCGGYRGKEFVSELAEWEVHE